MCKRNICGSDSLLNCNRRRGRNHCSKRSSCRENRFHNVILRQSVDNHIFGNSTRFNLREDDSEIQTNLMVRRVNEITVSGQIRDSRGRGIEGVKVSLVKISRCESKCIAETITNYRGFYEFNVIDDDDIDRYKVVVNES
ncbi:carboxypeptidase-like regulatory domain-containing protein [Clostridium cylindrosporum]|uniref:Carboxypeptidase regulatory-like domain-containing protein n=1 Tax=Clostridium cylindrosporum DSM 605 TaxID=1121307 RepID=A0A0J8D8Z4_CLOCY|nr:carboxypeptidase-like regulatory domain-containing protein [Clostridium cylindrosporum]KMT22347.1 hypothetical protein CLCY_20c00050 [Clostridium cylindrosporum DSM 605]